MPMVRKVDGIEERESFHADPTYITISPLDLILHQHVCPKLTATAHIEPSPLSLPILSIHYRQSPFSRSSSSWC